MREILVMVVVTLVVLGVVGSGLMGMHGDAEDLSPKATSSTAEYPWSIGVLEISKGGEKL